MMGQEITALNQSSLFIFVIYLFIFFLPFPVWKCTSTDVFESSKVKAKCTTNTGLSLTFDCKLMSGVPQKKK